MEHSSVFQCTSYDGMIRLIEYEAKILSLEICVFRKRYITAKNKRTDELMNPDLEMFVQTVMFEESDDRHGIWNSTQF